MLKLRTSKKQIKISKKKKRKHKEVTLLTFIVGSD